MSEKLFVLLVLCLLPLGSACGAAQAGANPDKAAKLKISQQLFQKNLRWGNWEEASAQVDAVQRQRFLAKYEESGDDFKITDLELKKVTLEDNEAFVEIEQQWYVEPVMTVKKERFVEHWKWEGGGWWMRERMRKDEWRARKVDKPARDSGAAPPREGAEPSPVESGPAADAKPASTNDF